MTGLDRSNDNDLLMALRHPLRRRILRLMGDGIVISPLELADRLDKSLSNVSYHVRVLAGCAAVTLVKTDAAAGLGSAFLLLDGRGPVGPGDPRTRRPGGRIRGGESGLLVALAARKGGDMDGSDDSWTTAGDDLATESVVLQQLLVLHPAQLTVAELVREVGGEQPDFAERDAIERAVRELSGVGLLHRREDFVLPTLAALRFSELLDR